MPNIHPSAHVSLSAELAETVIVGPGAVIGPNVRLGPAVEVGPHAVLDGHTTIGEGTKIFAGASIGSAPQDLKYRGEPTELEIGAHCTLREFVTLNTGTATGGGKTVIGDHCLLMAYVHVGHDSKVGHHCILANSVALAGHVHIGDHASIGGLTGIHQFCEIGEHAFIGGCSGIGKDVPPYFLVSGIRTGTSGINRIGLQRQGFSEETIQALHQSFKILYLRKLTLEAALIEMETRYPKEEAVLRLASFIRGSQRGIVKYFKG